jgi:hypothetical protein
MLVRLSWFTCGEKLVLLRSILHTAMSLDVTALSGQRDGMSDDYLATTRRGT